MSSVDNTLAIAAALETLSDTEVSLEIQVNQQVDQAFVQNISMYVNEEYFSELVVLYTVPEEFQEDYLNEPERFEPLVKEKLKLAGFNDAAVESVSREEMGMQDVERASFAAGAIGEIIMRVAFTD